MINSRSIILFALAFSFKILAQTPYKYPAAPKIKVIDNYFGTKVEDDYQWMEDHEDTLLLNWLNSEERVTKNHFNTSPYFKDVLNNIIEKNKFYLDLIDASAEVNVGLYSMDNGTSKVREPALYYKYKFDYNWKVFVDPKTLRKNPTEKIVITGFKLLPDKKHVMFSISRNGSDWQETYLKEIGSDKITDRLEGATSGKLEFFNDGIFYLKADNVDKKKDYFSMNASAKLFYHKFGTSQSQDVNCNIMNVAWFQLISENKLFVYHHLKKNTKEYTGVSYLRISDSLAMKDPHLFLIYPSSLRYSWEAIGSTNDSVIAATDFFHPNGMVLKYSLTGLNSCDTLIKGFSEVLSDAFIINRELHCLYYNKGSYFMVNFDKEQKVKFIHKFPEHSYPYGFISGDKRFENFFLKSYDKPKLAYQFDVKNYTSQLVKKTEIVYDPVDCIIENKTYVSFDGTNVPITLIYKKGLKVNSQNPLILNVYGGFGVINNPAFEYTNLLWLKSGGVIAIAHVRGGGEKGRNWHFSAVKINKQRSIEDLAWAAKFLIEQGYTIPEKMALTGASNGGLMVSATANKYPELFKAVIPRVGVYDMMRYENFTVGSNFSDEYGSVRDSLESKILYKYSPYHNIPAGKKYPSMLIMTSEFDDRVPPFHSYKFFARFREMYPEGKSLLYLSRASGHNGGAERKDQLEEDAVFITFLFNELNVKPVLLK